MDSAPQNSGDPYQFIMNPAKPPRRPLLGKLGGNSFIMKLVFIIGGAAVFMIAATIVVNIVFNDNTNVEDIVGLTQDETEIVLLSQQSRSATDQAIKDAAANTEISVDSQKNQWLAYLEGHGRSVGDGELKLKHNAALETELTDARQTSTFDAVFTETMRDQLTAYQAALESAFQTATQADERALLQNHYDQVGLLLKQWPEAQVPATNP